MPDTTIIYYTANMENPAFEERIRENLIKNAGGLPIISVSRKPINLGKNICVGEKPVCYSNSFRQLLIGLKEAKTEFCIAAEADCLYPPDYFRFTPPTENNVYRYKNVWLYFDRRIRFWRKVYVEAAQKCGRKFWINSIERVLKGHDTWKPFNPRLIFTTEDKYSWTGNPVIAFKTRKGIGFKTGFTKDWSLELPYWGSVEEVKKLVNYDNK